ncbi:speckle targeted PIP5K1A-regulated poly(A) polymerase [Eupeodes corollae]|uniref:speckle targeted PIP5K1A-regulated poly(A) polymerase n=1 Tax=Eupeodes corollae TaxID=290404 RepID=UPI00249068FB|nr:speckle targeted PIP5K1A-regulated poly(A) polymerase [Eupeodes corollae]
MEELDEENLKLKRKMRYVLDRIDSEKKKKFHYNLMEAISECEDGKELSVVFKTYLTDELYLSSIYSQISDDLKEELDKIGLFNIEPFESVANGLNLKKSAIALHVYSSTSKADPNIDIKLTEVLQKSLHFSRVTSFEEYSLVKCTHVNTKTALQIDVSEPYDLHNSEFVNQLKQADSRINELVMFLKIWFVNMGIVDENAMTKYCFTTLIVFYLQNTNPPILPAFKIIQQTAQKGINGTNYGLNSGRINMNVNKNIHELVKGFFEFYGSLDFGSVIIAPYLGKTINKLDFQNKVFQYPEYESQRRLLAASSNERVEELETQQTLCVQDMFFLNRNLANSIKPKVVTQATFEYFKICISLARNKCSEPGISLKNMYKSLLVNIINEIEDLQKTLSFSIIPQQNELTSLSKFCNEVLNIRKLWTRAYISAIPQIMNSIYKIDMKLLPPTGNCAFKNFDKTEELPLPFKWSISSQVDLWTGREMHRSSASFIENQLALTKKLFADRSDKKEFSVQFNATFSITIVRDFEGLIIEATNNETYESNNDLRKFFNSLRWFIRTYNLRHRIRQLESEMLESMQS